MDELIARNFQALSQGLKDQREELRVLKEEVNSKGAEIAELRIRLDQALQRLNIVFAKSMGSGSTT